MIEIQWHSLISHEQSVHSALQNHECTFLPLSNQATPCLLYIYFVFSFRKRVPHFTCRQCFSNHLPFWCPWHHLFLPDLSFVTEMQSCALALRELQTSHVEMYLKFPYIQTALGHRAHDPADETLANATLSHDVHQRWLSHAIWTSLYVVSSLLSVHHLPFKTL